MARGYLMTNKRHTTANRHPPSTLRRPARYAAAMALLAVFMFAFDPSPARADRCDDLDRSRSERRYFCFGRVDGAVMTVRFTWRNGTIRIFRAGYWRKGKTIYEEISGKIQQG